MRQIVRPAGGSQHVKTILAVFLLSVAAVFAARLYPTFSLVEKPPAHRCGAPGVQYGGHKQAPKKYVIAFADTKFAKTAERWLGEAKRMDVFDNISVTDEHTIGEEYLTQHKAFIEANQRGFGYWLYKPYVIWRALEEMEDGDLLAYVDIGCEFNPAGRPRLLEYFDIISRLPDGLLAFVLADTYPSGMGSMKEQCWNKGDTREYLNCTASWCMNVNQHVGGINFWKATPVNRAFARQWYEAGYADGYKYITDAPSEKPNHSCFKEHRHDQSIFSALVTLRKHYTGSVVEMPDETWLEESWQGKWDTDEALAVPIWAKRLKF